MKTDAPLGWSPGIIVLDAITVKNLGTPILHLYRNGKMILSHRLTQEFPGCFIKPNNTSHFIKLSLGVLVGIIGTFTH
jgi:hypothetical protein